MKRILAALAKKAPFDSLEAEQQRLVADAMRPLEVKAGAVLVKQGDDGQQCFLLDSGKLLQSSDDLSRAIRFPCEELPCSVCRMFTPLLGLPPTHGHHPHQWGTLPVTGWSFFQSF